MLKNNTLYKIGLILSIIIGISGKIGSGKTTISNFISCHEKTLILPFSQPLKQFATILGWDGKKDIRGRRLLQLIGTECGRECIDQDIWINKWMTMLNYVDSNSNNYYIIADDVRFQNEYDMIKNVGGIMLHIERSNLNYNDHISEKSINRSEDDYVVNNNCNLKSLYKISTKLHKLISYRNKELN